MIKKKKSESLTHLIASMERTIQLNSGLIQVLKMINEFSTIKINNSRQSTIS
jgi:hypothetical protein